MIRLLSHFLLLGEEFISLFSHNMLFRGEDVRCI